MKGAYDRALVEQLLPAVWDREFAYGMRNPYAPDPDMPKASVDKKKGSTLFAHLADIRQAWAKADVPQVERQVLLLRFGLDWKQSEVAAVQDVDRSTVQRRGDRAVGRLAAFLNGDTYTEGYGDAEPDDDVQV